MRRSSRLVAGIGANVLVALGCVGGVMGPSEPEYARDYRLGVLDPPPEFAAMDLPYYGGRIERSADGFMEVSYGDELTVDQIVVLWPAALQKEGWVQTSGGRNPDRGLSASFDTPDGGRGALTVKPTGTLWTVLLSKSPRSPP